MKKITLVFVFLFITISYPAAAKTFGAQEFTLSNGLQVVVIPNHRTPVVTHMLWVKAGGADNLSGQSGMAHYFEHLMFKGTPNLAAGEYSKTIKTLGGNDNAFTGADYTAFFESVAVKNLEKVMAMEADRFQNLAPPPAHFSSEKSVVLEERRQRTENDPRALFAEQIYATLFVNHPYGTPVIGWMDEIKSYEWADVKKYYDAWYAPNNMVLVVSGDITADELKPMAEKYYGPLKKRDVPKRVRPAVPSAIAQTEITLKHAQVHQPLFYKIYIAPTETKSRKDSLALQVLANILDGGSATRLYSHLVVQQKKAVDVSFSYDANALDYGTISIDITPALGVTPQEAGALLEQDIQNVVREGVTDTEVKSAVQRLQDQAVFARDSIAGPAMIFGSGITTGSRLEDIENWPEDIGKVTAADIKAAAQKYLDTKKPWVRTPVTGILLPAAQETAAKGQP